MHVQVFVPTSYLWSKTGICGVYRTGPGQIPTVGILHSYFKSPWNLDIIPSSRRSIAIPPQSVQTRVTALGPWSGYGTVRLTISSAIRSETPGLRGTETKVESKGHRLWRRNRTAPGIHPGVIRESALPLTLAVTVTVAMAVTVAVGPAHRVEWLPSNPPTYARPPKPPAGPGPRSRRRRPRIYVAWLMDTVPGGWL